MVGISCILFFRVTILLCEMIFSLLGKGRKEYRELNVQFFGYKGVHYVKRTISSN